MTKQDDKAPESYTPPEALTKRGTLRKSRFSMKRVREGLRLWQIRTFGKASK